MQTCGEVEAKLQASLPSVPEGGEYSVSCPSALTPKKGPLVGYRAGVRPGAGHEDPDWGAGITLLFL